MTFRSRDFKSLASTNFATRARGNDKSGNIFALLNRIPAFGSLDPESPSPLSHRADPGKAGSRYPYMGLDRVKAPRMSPTLNPRALS